MSDSESIKERVCQFIKMIGSNPNRFQESINVSGTYLKTVKNIGADKISKILEKYPQIDPEWLLLGKGDPLKVGGNLINDNKGTVNTGTVGGSIVTGNNNTIGDKDAQILLLENENKYLKEMLAEKERFIQALLNK